MTEKQIPKFVGALVEHQAHFVGLSVEDGQWAIQNTPDAIALCVKAISNREKEKTEVPTSSLIRVDRTIRPIYPDFMGKVLHPELELSGPREFDVVKLERCLYPYPDQANICTTRCQKTYEYLKTNKMLRDCLNFRDLEEIQKKGIPFFKEYFEHFQVKAVVGWKSIILSMGGANGLFVPYLFEGVISWQWWMFSRATHISDS